MKSINTHGLNINNLQEASEFTCACRNGSYIQIFYDTESCNLYTHYHASEDNWTRYDDAAVILICNTARHMSMQAIADAVVEQLELIKEEAWNPEEIPDGIEKVKEV